MIFLSKRIVKIVQNIKPKRTNRRAPRFNNDDKKAKSMFLKYKRIFHHNPSEENRTVFFINRSNISVLLKREPRLILIIVEGLSYHP